MGPAEASAQVQQLGPREDQQAARAELTAKLKEIDGMLQGWTMTVDLYVAKGAGLSGTARADADTSVATGCREAILAILELNNEILEIEQKAIDAATAIHQQEGGGDPRDPTIEADGTAAHQKLDAEAKRFAGIGMRYGLAAIRAWDDPVKRGTAETVTISIALAEFGADQSLREEVLTTIIRKNLEDERWYDTKRAANHCIEICKADEARLLAYHALAQGKQADDKDDEAAAGALLSAMEIATKSGTKVDARMQGDVVGDWIAILPRLDTPTLVDLKSRAADRAEIVDPIDRVLEGRDDYDPTPDPPQSSSSGSSGDHDAIDWDDGSDRWEPKVRRYWRNPPRKPALWIAGGYSAPIRSQRFEGARFRQPTGLDLGIDVLSHPRALFGFWYGYSGFESDEHPEIEKVALNRVELRFASDLIALPRQWPFRVSLSPLVGLGLGWLKHETMTEDRERKLGIGVTLGGQGGVHFRIKNLLLRLQGGVTKPIYAITSDEIADAVEKEFPRSWRWHAGIAFGFADD